MAYTLKPAQLFEGQKELYENGFPKLCPYRVPMMVQTSTINPKPVPVFIGCGTWCPLFELHKYVGPESNGMDKVFLNCSPGRIAYEVEPERESSLKFI